MKGLLYKDFKLIKRQLAIIGIFIFVMFINVATNKNYYILPVLFMLISYVITPTIIYHDVQSNFSKFIFATPCTKRDYVLSKYFPAFITAILSLFVNVIFSSFSGMSLQDIILIGTIGFSLSLLSIVFLIPMIFKFGVEKGKILMVIFYFIIFALISRVRKIMELVNEFSVRFQFLTIYHIGIILLILTLLITAVSIFISVKIIKNKDF